MSRGEKPTRSYIVSSENDNVGSWAAVPQFCSSRNFTFGVSLFKSGVELCWHLLGTCTTRLGALMQPSRFQCKQQKTRIIIITWYRVFTFWTQNTCGEVQSCRPTYHSRNPTEARYLTQLEFSTHNSLGIFPLQDNYWCWLSSAFMRLLSVVSSRSFFVLCVSPIFLFLFLGIFSSRWFLK